MSTDVYISRFKTIIMIYDHGGIALNLFNLKAVKKEINGHDGKLVFEFHNMIRSAETTAGSGIFEDKSYSNASITQYFEDLTDLELHYQEWLGIWTQFTAYVINLELPVDFKPNRL